MAAQKKGILYVKGVKVGDLKYLKKLKEDRGYTRMHTLISEIVRMHKEIARNNP